MNTMKLIYPLACALAFTLATTGCNNHKVGKTVPLPANNPPMVGDNNNPSTLPPPGNQFNPDANPYGTNGVIATSGAEFDNMTEDRDALKAYTVHFAFDSAAIKSSEKSNLGSVAAALKSDSSLKLLIEGNCDDRGTEEYNRSLGERRALAAREALAKDGIDPSRVRTISFGKDKPADPGHDEAAWSKNRRDDFVLLHPKAGA
jgi:peptidoglycan-associated lipoprotein